MALPDNASTATTATAAPWQLGEHSALVVMYCVNFSAFFLMKTLTHAMLSLLQCEAAMMLPYILQYSPSLGRQLIFTVQSLDYVLSLWALHASLAGFIDDKSGIILVR
jgi:hypothetical protein